MIETPGTPPSSIQPRQRPPAASESYPGLSDDGEIRHAKASESSLAAFAAQGIPDPPPAITNLVADFVNRATQSVPVRSLANMAAGSGPLSAAAQIGVSQVLSTMTNEQREAMKAGANPFNAADIARFAAMLAAHHPPSAARAAIASGARYDDINNGGLSKGDPGYYATRKGLDEMRAYASNHGLAWASGYPEILKLGPDAVKALADVQLKKENYERLRGTFKLSPADTVEAAKRAKQNDVNLNDVTQSASKLNNDLPPNLRPEFQRAVKDYLPKIGDEQERSRFNARMDELQKKDPAHAPAINELKKKLHTSGAEAKKLDVQAAGSERKAGAAQQGADAAHRLVANNEQARNDSVAQLKKDEDLLASAVPASAAPSAPATPAAKAASAAPQEKKDGAPQAKPSPAPTQQAKAATPPAGKVAANAKASAPTPT